MNRRQYLAGLGLAVSTGAAGCSMPGESSPTPGGQQISVNFSNESDRTVVFTAAAVADGLGGVRITYRDDSERTFEDVETIDNVPVDAWENAVTFEPLAESQRRQFRSTGGSGTGIQFDPMSFGTTVVTTVAAPDQEHTMWSVGAGSCGDAESADYSVRVDSTETVHLQSTCVNESDD